MTTEQRAAYDKAINHISGRNTEQLIMFISGEGGTGKSSIIALIMEFTRLKYGKQLGLYGATVAMAPTGCSANVISGFTWQSCYGKGKTKDKTGTMTSTNATKVGERFRGTKLLVIDEISMINLESLSEISYRHQQGMLAMTEDDIEKNEIMAKPFGGTHILFTGDLWQLKPIGGSPIFTTKALKSQAISGQKIWHSINEYSELTENYRFKNDTSSTLQDFLRGARVGRVDKELLMKMNTRLIISRNEAIRQAHPSAIWIAHTKESVRDFNKADFMDKVTNNVTHFRVVATHSPATILQPAPTVEENELLFQLTKIQGPPPYMDLAIGTRVSCVQNLGTQIGNNIKINTKF